MRSLPFLLLTLAAIGCRAPASRSDAPSLPSSASPAVDAQSATAPSGTPRVGAHVLAFHRLWAGLTLLTTSPMTTQASGSTMLVSVGRGEISAFASPTDDKSNVWRQLGTTHAYSLWSTSGTALYGLSGVVGGAGHTLRVTTPADDEITLAAVEIVNGRVIHDQHWNEVLAGAPLTTKSVTTTGPATLVAFWWGDGGADADKTATPNNGFVVIDSILQAGALVQCAVATREVAAAGTYDVTWSATPVQGAQLWLIALQ